MGRQRKEGKKLPPNLYVRNGYYRYRDQASGRMFGLGRNKAEAIAQAVEANMGTGGKAIKLFRENPPDVRAQLLGLDEIIARSQKAEEPAAIYFLLLDGKVVYVGQSINWPRRLYEHLLDGTKRFDAFTILKANRFQLDDLEAAYINQFRPVFNLFAVRRPLPLADISVPNVPPMAHELTIRRDNTPNSLN